MSRYIGRFAPSPTGPLHFGSLVAALASYLDARHYGGQWLLRIEDVDTTRCKPEWAEHIVETLRQFGFAWDGPIEVQSQLTAHYQQAFAELQRKQLVYPCTCTRREIADSGLQGLDGPIYPGTCREAHRAPEGAAWRLRTMDEVLGADDLVQGRVEQRLESQLGDFVLKRRDGLFAYQLAVVVDDARQQVTHVVRGADLLESTPRQVYLQSCLDLAHPEYLHFPVAVNDAGQKLSKQTFAPSISAQDACRLLAAGLEFLGQTTVSADSPAMFLEAALRGWARERIPRRRAQELPRAMNSS